MSAEQRRVRVTAGLAELDIWLGDQVRTGLAQTDRTFRAFEAIAARMVDAQAPGIAATLRQLPALVAARAEWPELVLREFARLHLLITAHQRLDELAPELQASIRTHIGYPVAAAAVRTEPAVRDLWLAVGVRITEDERLYTRRTQLYGRMSGRWALVIEHSFGAPSFAAEVPALGTMVDADVHYYPGAAPMRVQWGRPHGPAEPYTTIPGTDRTPAAALRAHAEALGADPWLRSWPVLLADVAPIPGENGWYLAESDGAALPMVAGFEPWQLLGISGGFPVTVAAEWTVSGLRPMSVLATGVVTDLGSAEMITGAPRTAPSADLVSVALLGTARRIAEPGRLDPPVGAIVTELRADPAFALLESAALQDLYTRGGVSTATATPLAPADDDPRQLLPDPAAARLAKLLLDRAPYLAEWLAAAAPHDYRAPDLLCAQLLDYALSGSEHREGLLRLAGARGRWLAGQHPEWRTLLPHYPVAEPAVEPDVSDEVWLFGQPVQRREWLRELRRRDPDRARQVLTAAWPKETGPIRPELLALLADGLSTADEALLDAALDDRRAEVRRTAAGLLTRLPDSGYAQRMTQRVRSWIRIEHPGRHPRFVIELPEALADDARRDGITDRTVEFSYRWSGVPDVIAGRVRQLVAATPLTHWASVLGSDAASAPSRATGATIDDRFRQPVFDGWVDATLAQRDSAWARALFDAGVPSDLAMLRRRELFALLPVEDRTRHLLRLDGAWLSEIEALLPAMDHPWPSSLAQHLLLLLYARAQAAARRPGAPGSGPNGHRSLFAAAAVHLPVDAAGAAAIVARKCADPGWERVFTRLAHHLDQRSTMLEELQ